VAQDWDNPDFRIRLREFIRQVVNKLVIDIPSKSYVIHYNNGKTSKVECFRKAYRIDGKEYITAKGLKDHDGTIRTYADVDTVQAHMEAVGLLPKAKGRKSPITV
jgi:hypothetical protein